MRSESQESLLAYFALLPMKVVKLESIVKHELLHDRLRCGLHAHVGADQGHGVPLTQLSGQEPFPFEDMCSGVACDGSDKVITQFTAGEREISCITNASSRCDSFLEISNI